MGPATPADMARWHDAVQDLAARTRLGIPVTLSSDPRHGFVSNPATGTAATGFSQWPEPLWLGAVRDPDLVRAYAATVRRELAAAGISVLLGPTLDVASEPRWARTVETFGADPELVTTLAVAFLDGFTADADVPPVAATIMHFPGGGPQKDGEDPHFDHGKEQVYPGGAFDLHLRPFADVLTRYPVQVMPYYGVPTGLSLDGGPVDEVGFAFNRRIITGLLRETLGFSGLVCTDFALVTDRTVFGAPMRARAWGVEDLDRHERVMRILNAGCDQLGGEVAPELVVDLVCDGRLTEERLDTSVRRILAEKFRLGLFERGSLVRAEGDSGAVAAGLDAQRRSVVVVENRDAVLPMREGCRVYAEGVDSQVLAGYADVVDDPVRADVALLRVDAPYEPRSEGFERFFHAGSLSFSHDVREHVATLAGRVPVVLDVMLDRAALLGEIAGPLSALTASFGVSDSALLDVVFGRVPATGALPFEICGNAEELAARRPDVPFDSAAPAYPHRHGLTFGRPAMTDPLTDVKSLVEAGLAAAPTPRTARVVVDDGTEIAYHRWEPDPDVEPHPVPVVLQHGFTVDTMVEWASRGTVAALTAAGRTVVGVDARGHGLSQKSPDPSRYGEPRMARDLRAVIGLLDVPAVDLVGYSMGSIISLLVAAEEPKVRRLVVGGVGAGVVEVGGVDTRELDGDVVAEAFLADDPSALPPEMAGMRAFAEMVGADFLSLAAQARALHTGGVDFARITAESLVIAGDEDPLAVRPEVLADALPNARLVIVPGDHNIVGSNPDFRAAVVDFLRN
ncbi:alpha/beta fold hydrolase [Lentzea sp. NPDC034063]|uniref:alpha/beta fold hydrolase n=1 Tax=unclassified Lentzea TaxID=2643253 RepID=UPI0033C0A7DE